MRIPRITVDVMAAIIALAETRSYESAAKRLGLTPSAVQKRISAATELMGSRLVLHTEGGVRLTESGEVFYVHAIKAMEQVVLMEEATLARSEVRSRPLLIGHSTYIAPRLLALLHDRHLATTLGVRLRHKSSMSPSLVQDVVEGRLDAGIGCQLTSLISTPDLVVYPLIEEPVMVCMPSDHKLGTKATLSPRDLEGEPIIAIGREALPALHKEVEEYFSAFGIPLNVIADAYGPPEGVALTEQRLGVCFLPAADIRAKTSVVVRPLTPRTFMRRTALFVRAGNRHPALKAFVDLILERAGAWRGGR